MSDDDEPEVAEAQPVPAEEKPAASSTASSDEEDVDVIFQTLWDRVLVAWDDDKPHVALLDYALKKEMLPQLAGRYRSLKDDPEKGPRAEKKINGIVVAATQMLMATKTPPRTKTPWQITASVGAIMMIVLAALYHWMFGRHH